MRMNIKLWLLVLMLVSGCTGRRKFSTTRGFYYWKSVIGLSGAERAALERLHTDKLYIKFFDVVWDAVRGQAVPVAKINFTDSTASWLVKRGMTIIPTVFITNECMQQAGSGAISSLSRSMASLLSSMAAQFSLEPVIPEIQIDCDWTAGTKDRYFSLLSTLQEEVFFKGKEVSATIRLYQCKYKLKTGVPPVKKGLLMCYNMGNLKNPATRNSIIEARELEQYIGNLSEYPLPLDVALPLFDWKVLFHEGMYKGLIRELPDLSLKGSAIVQQEDHIWRVERDTLVNGYSFVRGDVVRKEDVTFDEVMRVTRLLEPKLANTSLTIVLYHLDSLTLHKFSTDELEKMFGSFD